MTIENVILSNGMIIGATVNDNGKIKRARLSDLQKLVEHNKITSGAKIIKNRLYISDEILANHVIKQSNLEFKNLIRDDDGKIQGAELSDGKTINNIQLWSLAADDRLPGVTAGYMKATDTKVVMTA